MLYVLICAVLLLAACLIPLIVYGDPAAFFKRDAVLWGMGGVAVLVAILVNLMADKFPRRYDLTAEHKYSVSPEMRNIISKLDDQAKITYYAYSTLQQFVPLKRDLVDKLNEIKNASGGKIDLEVVDVNIKDEALVKELDQKGFPIQANEKGEGGISFSKLYSGLKITYKDKEAEYIPKVIYADDLEVELAPKLIPWTLTNKPIIAIDAPKSEHQQQMPGRQQRPGPFDWLAQGGFFDAKRFDVKSIDLTENNSVPKGTRLLLLLRPKDLNDRQRYEVVKYLAEGGSLLFLGAAYKTTAEFGTLRAEKISSGLEDYFKEVGISLGTDFIADKSHLQQSFVNPFTGEVMQQIEDPFFLRILPEYIDQESVLTRLMPNLVMPHASEIILDDKLLAGSKMIVSRLARTTDHTWMVPFREDMKPELELDKEGVPAKHDYVPSKRVFAMVKGQFPFPYTGKPVPQWTKTADDKDKDKDKDKDNDKDKKPAEETASATLKEGTLVICSAPDAFNFDYLTERTLSHFMQSNPQLLANVSESISLGDDLVKLRARKYETRTISGLAGDNHKDMRDLWNVLLVFGAPVLILILSVYYFVFRRVNQLRYERNYAETTGPSSFSK